jgi:NADPH:quinone reductase
MPSARHLSIFASALVTGSAEFPIAEIPFQDVVDRVADGTYKAKPSKVFEFSDIREAHRLMESSGANGKIVVRVSGARTMNRNINARG